MSAVIITGMSAAGKSTIAAELARRGLTVIDSDSAAELCRFVDATGNVVVDEPEAPDLAWLAEHGWNWDPIRLDELIRAAGPAPIYVCGGADNQLELADRFSHFILLEIDERTMLARLDDPDRDNEWGRVGETREYLRRRLPRYQEDLRAFGAIPIDATQSIAQVADDILARTS
jgi:shikimate kinase